MYIYTEDYYRSHIAPLMDEDYTTFMARCVTALMSLDPRLTEEEARAICDSVWAAHILKYATQATVTLRRSVDEHSVYNDPYDNDWKIAEIHSAVLPKVTFSSVEKAKAVAGKTFNVAKSAEDKQLVFGWANVAKDANGNFPLDWDGDVTTPESLEAAAYTFVLKYRAGGEKHEGETIAQLVESVMFTKEKQEALGIPEGIVPEGWWVGFYVPDAEIFAKIKSGEYEMFSVQGQAARIPTGQ